MHVLVAVWKLWHTLHLSELLTTTWLNLRVLLQAKCLAHTINSIVLHVHFRAATVAKFEHHVLRGLLLLLLLLADKLAAMVEHISATRAHQFVHCHLVAVVRRRHLLWVGTIYEARNLDVLVSSIL